MPYYWSKVLPMLFMPVTLSLLASLVALSFIWRRRRLPALVALIVAIANLWVFALPAVAARLMWSLESQYLPVRIEDIPASDCIIVLGGALGVASYPRVNIELTDAVDRVYQAAELFRANKARIVIVAAGNQPWLRDLVPEAEQIRTLLANWGVPPDSILLDSESANTRENAVNARALIREVGCESNLLVTSSWHMPRAVAAFGAVGIPVFAVPVDVRVVGSAGISPAGLIPRADALATSSQAILEWMGIWVYRWRGWA